MSTESSNNEVNQFVADLAASDRLANNSAQREVYGVTLPSVLVDFSADNVVQSGGGLASIKDTFSPPPPPPKPKETSQYLPSVTVSSSRTADAAYQTLRRQAEETLSDNLKEKLTSILMADLNSGPEGLEGFDLDLFNAINEYRTSQGLNELEYDPNLRDRAMSNNDQQRAHGLGHYVGGNEIAGGHPSVASVMAAWKESGAHDAIMSDPAYTRMGPAGDTHWQSVQFGR